MSRIFLSHSSVDERQAVAVTQWLAENGWDDVFLDLDPERGFVAGERWQEALRQASDRCEAVVCVLSPAWADSKWCVVEFYLAKTLHKLIFGVVVKEVPLEGLPPLLTSEWQLCHLVGGGPTETVRFSLQGASDNIEFLSEGLTRFRNGLKKAGIDGDHFPWPPSHDTQRAPYRGLEPLEDCDAAVFFGRDVEILRGLDALRGMRASGDQRLFSIVGASGAGKSSFLRAGLWPRLKRDDRHFFPLAVVRPEREPLFGERGLAAALHRACGDLNLTSVNLGEVKARLREGVDGFAGLVQQLGEAAHTRFIADPGTAPRPTIILPVDQTEELFNPDAGDEAKEFLHLIGGVLRAHLFDQAPSGPGVPLVVVFTIRSDRYEPLQTAPALAGLRTVVFDDLKPMSPTRFREVILGPAARASLGGSRLEVRPDLVERLVAECAEGGDTLPLLGLTLARLYRDYASDGDLRLDEYEGSGGLASIVRDEAESVLDAHPDKRRQQLGDLRAAFVPWLATINPRDNQPMRRVARLSELPAESRPLVLALAERRLLLTDRRGGETVVEVAHEALLRRWNVLVKWLQEEGGDLKDADDLERAAQLWEASGSSESWLLGGERLEGAEGLAARPGYRQRLDGCHDFLVVSRLREEERRAESERRQRAELQAAQRLAAAEQARADEAWTSAARIRKRSRALIVALTLLVVALGAVWWALRQSQARFREATALRLVPEATSMLLGGRVGGDERALLQLLAANRMPLVAEADVEASLFGAMLQVRHLLKLISVGTPVLAAAYSPDGHRIVTGGQDGTLRLWDARTGNPLGAPIEGHKSMVTSVAYSPDGRQIVSGSGDNTLRLWDAETGKSLGSPLEGVSVDSQGTGENTVSSVAFSPNGRLIVSGGFDKTLRLWDVETGKPIDAPLKGHREAVLSVAYSPEGRRIVSGSGDMTLRLWDAETGKAIGEPLRGHKSIVNSVAYSRDGLRFVSGSEDGTVRLWDSETGMPVGAPLEGHKSAVTSVGFSPDGRWVASGSFDETVRLWDAENGKPLGSPLEAHKGAVRTLAFSPDGRRIVSGSDDKTLRLWDAGSWKPLGSSLEGHKGPIRSFAYSTDGLRIVSGSDDGTLRLWDAETGEPIGVPLAGHTGTVTSVAFSPDGRWIVSGGEDSTLRLWDAETGKPIGAPLEGHKGALRSVAYSPDGRRFVSGGEDATLRLWDSETGKPIGAPLVGHYGAVRCLAYSPDGRRIASGGDDSTLRLWDSETGKLIGGPLEVYEGAVTSVAYSPDGRRIVSGARDNTLRQWGAETGKPIGVMHLPHPYNIVTSVAYSPDGRWIVSGSDDSTLQLWDAKTEKPIGAPLEGHRTPVTGVAFSPDGRQIISSSSDSTLHLWPAPAAWTDELCAKLTRNMSRKHWREWVSSDIDYVIQCPGLPISPDEPEAAATSGAQ